MQSQDILNEKSLEIILNFKPSDKYDKSAVNEILKLKGNIKKIITLLSRQEQEVLDLRYFQNLSCEKIAQCINKSKDEVEKILIAGTKNIKEKLKQGDLVFEKIQKVIELPKIKQETKEPQKEQKQIKQTPAQKQAEIKRQPSFFAFIFSLAFYVILFAGSYFIIQKYFLHNLPALNQLFLNSRDFALETGSGKSAGGKNKAIRISGSSSLFVLARRWENSFHIDYPKYHIDLISSDSDKGINSLIEGRIDIANSSRPITFLDRKRASEHGLELAENRVALDALIIIVNKKNPVDEISLDALEKIFSNEIKNWKEVSLNSFEKPLTPVIREKGSGTNEFVINRVLQGDSFSSSIISKNLNNELIRYVAEHEGAISFTNSTNYPWKNQDIKYLKVKNYDNSPAVSPFEEQKLNKDAIRYGDYPLAHYLYLITQADAPKNVQNFILWVLSKEGQKIVAYSGLIPVYNE
ncbi:MAG: hypothetical protein A3I68_01135 [Candidatus Melainabacteria bacterium RIFCSPLOWO2_02_FULL_35_15]|nr:MAG: hypothetical protein A3F80_09110 [Candidatus Melainabacteria bacterium RIFCSPLOWO2_12_FULL_35_11]OGI13378.1 MAG: hypothetical protein A3I68_01135 [Candidatus Melainabacteria bacterium RIFCSPLOWO2_02_FULL_35_15]